MEHRNKPVKIGMKISGESGMRSEWVWAIPLAPQRFRIENIPFFVDGVNFKDVVDARPDAKGMLHFRRVILRGGHRTFRMVLVDKVTDEKRQALVAKLTTLGCLLERGYESIYAISVPPGTDLDHVLAILDSERDLTIWEFERAG